MAKLLTFFVFILAISTILSATVEGTTAFATSTLEVAIDEDDVTIEVVSTDDFSDSDYAWIENERIFYTGKNDATDTLTGVVRGSADENGEGGEAVEHAVGAKIMNNASGAMNVLLGYNLTANRTELGTMDMVRFASGIFTKALPKIIMWDYSFLQGDLALIKYAILYPLTAGFVLALVGFLAPIIRSILPF